MIHDDWIVDEPPSDFADRVMQRVGDEPLGPAIKESPALRRRTIAALLLAAGLAASFFGVEASTGGRGEVAAEVREEVRVGRRATAVLEPGAHVRWAGSEVTQTAGEVFYRVEQRLFGGPFRVHTPEGDVEVLGTCFRVRVLRSEAEMNRRDVKVGSLGAALSAAVLVSVYEGKVSLSHAAERLVLTAGESARGDESGAHRTGTRQDDAEATAGTGTPVVPADPLLAANANLADSVREYRRRLEAIETQKAIVEKQLEEAKQKLTTAANDGPVPAHKSEFDLSQDDWKKLAKEGKVVARAPCSGPDSWDLSPKTLAAQGLAPEDGKVIHDALRDSASRMWTTLRPLCAQALQGDPLLADKLGPATCETLVRDVAERTEKTDEEVRKVAEIRAGLLPMPTDPKVLGAWGQVLYTMSGEAKAIEQQLANTIGPVAAQKFVFGEVPGSWCSNTWGVGPRLAGDRPKGP